MDAYVTPTNDIEYSCHIRTIEIIWPIIYGVYIMPPVVHSLRGVHTHTHTCKQTFADRSNSSRPVWTWLKNTILNLDVTKTGNGTVHGMKSRLHLYLKNAVLAISS